jgi:hypothetical protein
MTAKKTTKAKKKASARKPRSLKNSDAAEKRRLANLKPFRPGESGNPDGRPPAPKCLRDLAKRIGTEAYSGASQKYLGKGYSNLEVMLRIAWDIALTGAPWAIVYLSDRMEGRPKQPVELEDKRGPLSHLMGKSDEELAEMERELESRL